MPIPLYLIEHSHLSSYHVSRRTLTLVTLPVESIDIDLLWNTVIDTVNEAEKEDTTVKSEPIQGKIASKVAADLAALRVSP
jgi:hypothetical protein